MIVTPGVESTEVEEQLASFTCNDYLNAFVKINLTATRQKMLRIHWLQNGYCLSAGFMARAMGWEAFATANCNYGRMAGCIGNELGIDVGMLECKSSVLVTMEHPNGWEWEWTLRPDVARAIETAMKQGLLDPLRKSTTPP